MGTRAIRFARGDLYAFPFSVEIDGKKSLAVFDDIWFTVKKKFTDPEALISKRLKAGTIIGDGHGTYVVTILPEDTEELCFGEYVYDIQVQKLPGIKKTTTGTLELTWEATWKSNEGDGSTPAADIAEDGDMAGIIAGDEITKAGNEALRFVLDIGGRDAAHVIIWAPECPFDRRGNEDAELYGIDIATAAEARAIIDAYAAV